MWHQHWCLLGTLASLLIFLDSLLILQTNKNLVQSFDSDPGLQTIVSKYSNLVYWYDLIGSVVCLSFWLSGYIFSILPVRIILRLKLRTRPLSEFLWGFVIRPYLLISIPNLVRQSLQVINNSEYANIDVKKYVEGLLKGARKEYMSANLTRPNLTRMYKLQRQYQCCGLDSANDWIDIMKSPNITSESQPWAFTQLYVPSSCCDPVRYPLCSTKLLRLLIGNLNQMEHHILSDHLPVFVNGCLDKITKRIVTQIQNSYWLHLLISILLRFIQIPICFAVFYRTHPVRRKSNSQYQKTTVHNNEDEHDDDSDDDDDERNLNNADKLVQSSEKQYHFFRGSTGFVSNARLLAIFKSFPAFAQPSMLQLAFAKLKAKWLEKDMRIGWTFKHQPTHSYTSFIQQLNWDNQNEADRSDLDKLRKLFRRNLPVMEVLCFADGNFDEKVDSNTLYYGLISMLFRGLIFFLFSILSAQILLWAFLEGDDGGKQNLDTDLSSDDNDNSEHEREMLVKNIAWMAQLFVRISIILGASLSKRFRCLLLLLIPSLGLAVGQSFIAAELIHTIMIGPGKTIQYNLEAAARSLVCMMELASNMTRDARTFIQDTQISFGNGSQTNFLNLVKDESRKLTTTFKQYGKHINKIMNKLDKSLEMAEKAESLLHFQRSSDLSDEENDAQSRLSRDFIQLTQKLNKQAAEGFEKQIAESEAYAKKMFSNMKNSSTQLQNMTRKIAQGFEIDNNMRRQMTASCLAFQQAKQAICHALANEACGTLQTSLSVALWLPILVKRPCIRRSLNTGECMVSKIYREAKRECASTNADSNKGIGWLFLQARDSFQVFEDAFNLKIGSFGLNLNQMFDWISDRKAMVVSIAAQTGAMIKGLFRFSLVLSQFVELLCLLVFFKAHGYINKYMNDPDFDNIYIGTTFEHIDARRFSQNRETLLPLKSDEKKKFIWRTKKYTGSEMVRAMTSLIKAIGGGLCLSLIFLIDIYIGELIGLLDEVTKIKIKIGDGTHTGSKPPTIIISGKGVLTNMMEGFLQVVQRISELDLEYDMSVCSPKSQQTNPIYRSQFITLWIIMLITALLSGYLLRLRHMILDFFYPKRMKRRMVHLYNSILTNRRRQLTISRNLLVNKSRVDELQETALQRSKRSLIYTISPQLAKRIGLAKMRCILCLEKVKLGPNVFHCPYDDTSTCRSCLETFFDGNKICVICLDRDPVVLFEKDQELQKYKFLFGYNKM